jgi:2-octaprenyl-6-methoxyphenol hydroxylase
MEMNCDVAIVGGGPVGLALAAATAKSGLNTQVLEASKHALNDGNTRTLALSHGSRLILDRLGAWRTLDSVTEIHSIHVSQRGGFGRAILKAGEARLPALGYVMPYARLHHALAETCVASKAQLHQGAEVVGASVQLDHVTVEFIHQQSRRQLSARLLVIADGGGKSAVGTGLVIKSRDYGQHAIIANVRTSLIHQHCAYERFTPDGPVALLPFGEHYALVWTAPPEAVEHLLVMPDADFLLRLQRHFGDRAGRFLAVGPRARFPLALRYAQSTVLPRRVLLGNAAQALHPIAGQGFNLGLRDAWELGETIAARVDADPGSIDCLGTYARRRRLDRVAGIALTHSLVELFSNDLAPLRWARGLGIGLLDALPMARKFFTRRMVFGAPL